MLTISSGYDPGYLTRAVATGRENYYLSAVAEQGEPPGIWTGRGCPQLGLAAGSQVDNKVMERLYGAFADPRDPAGQATLGRAPSGFAGHDEKISGRLAGLLAAEPEATQERRDQIIMQALKDQRVAVYFFDATFSVPKSVSLLHASLQVRAQQAREAGQAGEAERWTARAQVVWDAIMAGNQAMLEYLQREAGYSRAGYHGKGSGRFADAHEWVIASFAQHTSRDHDPQLHVHNAILNRVLREDPLASRPGDRRAWRTLDGTALYAAKPAAGAIAERTLAEYLTARLDVVTVARADGNGFEIAGISEAVRDQFSSRRRAIGPRVRQLVEEYERKHGRAPDARAVWSMAQFVTLDSRRAKAHSAPSRETLLAQWETQSRRAETEALSAIPDAVFGRRRAGRAARPPSGAGLRRMLAAAVAEAQRGKATFSRYELTRMISRHLPDHFGGLDGAQVTALLEDLASQALRPGGPADTVLLTAPEMVPVPEAYRRADGLSLWRRHGAEIYTTRAMLDTETRLLRAAAQNGAPAIAPDRAAALLGADRARIEARLWRQHGHPGAPDAPGGGEPPLSDTGLADDQAQAAYGVLTSGRAIDILVGPAGTGKTRTVARLARAWRDAGAGRVMGLTTSTNAAHVLAAEGLGDSHSLADFLGRIEGSDRTRGHLPVTPGDLLVIDEASMVSTADLAAVEDIATRWSAKILLTGDTEQLSAPEASGAMRLLADEHGYYQLHTVQRFDQEWERAASLRLRAGDASVLAEYDQRGRILEGTREQMTEAAYRRWLADHLTGRESLLMVTTNEQAAELARRARDELAALGLVAIENLAGLADGNVAGEGDLIVARQNIRIEAGEPGRMLANRDVLRIEAWAGAGEERAAVVRRIVGRTLLGVARWSAPFELPADYIEAHAQLAYAANVHVAEGRTSDTSHLVVDETAGREAFYVGMGRARQRNTAYVITERGRAADLSPEPRPAPGLEDPGAAGDAPPRLHRLVVLAGVLERQQTARTATESMRQDLDRAASLATLAPIWADVTRTHATRRYEKTIRSLLAAEDWQQYQQDAERGTLARLLRAAGLAGHDTGDLLRRALEGRDFAGARSVAGVLHGRVSRLTGTPEPMAAASYADRTPVIEDPEADRFARELATAMDERVSLLGNQVAMDRPAWALRYLGEVPADPVERAEWTGRAGAVAAYREERGYADEVEAIGPAPERGSPEQRASWHAAYVALELPGEGREVAAATDGELLARRAAYERDTTWAPPYVADELRDAHIAEDTYRADAVLAWHRADAAPDEAGRAGALREAEEYGALAQEIGAYREALTEVAEARRRWHAATEQDRQRALTADTELRRRHPEAELPPLHTAEEAVTSNAAHEASGSPSADQQLTLDLAAQQAAGPAALGNGRDPDAGPVEARTGAREAGRDPVGKPGAFRHDVSAALEAARIAEKIIATRELQADRDSGLSDDVMHRREAEARQEASARASAVRQDPAPSRHSRSLELDEPELEAGL
jgi:conjugative relaxase-like TrwC/TraI family protein